MTTAEHIGSVWAQYAIHTEQRTRKRAKERRRGWRGNVDYWLVDGGDGRTYRVKIWESMLEGRLWYRRVEFAPPRRRRQ